jgi:uncharacterized protein (TIGR03067 family)
MCIFLVTAALIGAEPMSEAAKAELKLLQGKWVVREFGRYGTKVDLAGEPELLLEIKDTKWIFTGEEKGEIVAIYPDGDPKCLDIKSVEERRKGRVDEAIYKLEGDTLTICWHQGKDKKRPGRFETNADEPDTVLAVFQRVKEGR